MREKPKNQKKKESNCQPNWHWHWLGPGIWFINMFHVEPKEIIAISQLGPQCTSTQVCVCVRVNGNSSIMAFSFFVSSPHENVRCAKPIGSLVGQEAGKMWARPTDAFPSSATSWEKRGKRRGSKRKKKGGGGGGKGRSTSRSCSKRRTSWRFPQSTCRGLLKF